MDHYLRWIYDAITCIFVEGTVSSVLRHTITMRLPLNTEFYGRYSVENDTSTTIYDTVPDRVTNHPGLERVNHHQPTQILDRKTTPRSFRISGEGQDQRDIHSIRHRRLSIRCWIRSTRERAKLLQLQTENKHIYLRYVN